jgi:hypothetical protein
MADADLFREKSIVGCSFGWWFMADADLFREKSIVGWFLVAGLF